MKISQFENCLICSSHFQIFKLTNFQIEDMNFISPQDKTVFLMIKVYCKRKHNTTNELCADCNELFLYSQKRVEKCPFGENKPICASCKVHCYKPDKREQIRQIMRFSGPKMTYLHPYYAFMHLWDKVFK